MTRVLSLLSAAAAAALIAGSTAPRLLAADDILQRTRALYAGLQSYADTGAVLYEYGTGSRDRHTFTTYLNRTPRRFYFDFRKEGGGRNVIWGDPEAFHTWDKTTGMQYDYPNPDNLGAFSTAGYTTYGSAMKIPLLWYPKANLQGTFTTFTDPTLDGTEAIGGRECYRLVGVIRDVYTATGRETNIRRLIVWIDKQSLLVRKVFEKPKDSLPGHIDGTTTTYEPQANPTLDESKFRFTKPTAR